VTWKYPAILASAAFLASPALATAHQHQGTKQSLQIQVINAKGESLGEAKVEQTSAGVLVTLEVSGLPEGDLGFHVHERGLCEPATDFSTAGGHFEPGSKAHGFKVENGHHAGDMPNLMVGADGKARIQVLNNAVMLDGGEAGLMDADGSALVIHAGPDDYVSQPSGASGARIACAVISAPQE